MFIIFLSALAVGFSGAMMPGSLLTYTIRKSLSHGPRAGFVITAGHAVLELVLIILIFQGFNMVLQSDAAQTGIGIIGGLLLIYMGTGMAISSIKNKVTIDMEQESSTNKSMLLSGIVISITNPYFILWWAVIGLGFVMQSYNTLGYMGVITYYVGHITADFVWYGLISIVIGTTRRFIKEKPYRIIIVILGCLLVFFGARFVVDAMMKLPDTLFPNLFR